jgi:hypothetical protein
MQNTTLVDTGDYAFKKLGTVRGSQYKCCGECQQAFTIPGVYEELDKQEQAKHVNALGQAWRRKCTCSKEAPAVPAPKEAPAVPAPTWDPTATPAGRWTEFHVTKHLEYHRDDHQLGTLHRLRPAMIGGYITVWETIPTGLLSPELIVPAYVLLGIKSLKPVIHDLEDELAVCDTVKCIVKDIERRVRYSNAGEDFWKKKFAMDGTAITIDEDAQYTYPMVDGNRRKSWMRLTVKEQELSIMSDQLKTAQRDADDKAIAAAEAKRKFWFVHAKVKRLKTKLNELDVESDHKWKKPRVVCSEVGGETDELAFARLIATDGGQ